MLAYVLRRLLLIIPTLFGIMVVNFIIVQSAPGGPVEQALAKIKGHSVEATARVSGTSGGEISNLGKPELATVTSRQSKYRGAQGLDPKFIKEIEQQFGFDKPAHERFYLMMSNYLRFNFGNSFFRDRSVFELVVDKMPVSISLGLWTTVLVYLISIPLGVAKAVRDGSTFDVWSSVIVVIGNAVPAFLFAIALIVIFAGGRYLDWFPLRGLTSDNFGELSTLRQITDYFWHMALPILSMVIGGFAGLTMLTKNSFLDEINKQYVVTAHSKGLKKTRVLYGHVFRNAMLVVVAGFPSAFVSILFTGALLTEIIFSLDGLGLLGFEAAINRDYPVMFGTLYFFTLLGLLLNLLGDIMYHFIDPRINFEKRKS
jgi:microcin C transport system permease protein